MSRAAAASTARPLRVLWIATGQQAFESGLSESGLAWLRQRLQQFQCAARPVVVIDHAWPQRSEHSLRSNDTPRSEHSLRSNDALPGDRQRLLEIIEAGVERIVVACVNRLDYPAELIQFLQRACPEVPLAVASETWWDGRRRTGLATPGELSLAWYRWWDGWVDWLLGSTASLFEVAPASWQLLSSPPPAAVRKTRGLIVGNCRQSTQAWALAASAGGHAAQCVSWQNFQQQFPAAWATSLPHWVLWDDSCLDRLTRYASMQLFFELLTAPVRGTPASLQRAAERPEEPSSAAILGILSVSMPRADWALQLNAAPARELLVKPSAGQGLTRLLNQYALRVSKA